MILTSDCRQNLFLNFFFFFSLQLCDIMKQKLLLTPAYMDDFSEAVSYIEFLSDSTPLNLHEAVFTTAFA